MAKRNEIFLFIFTAMTPEYLMMYFKLAHAAANLASPIIALQDVQP